jgi:hypothetical protein
MSGGSLQGKVYGGHKNQATIVKKLGSYNSPVRQLGNYNKAVKRLGVYNGIGNYKSSVSAEMYPNF